MTAPIDGGPAIKALVVQVADVRCAFVLDEVVEVLPALATTALPGAPEIVDGMIDLRGALVPVLDLRRHLGLPARAPDCDDHVVVCDVGPRRVGIWVDRAEDVVTVASRDLVPVDDVAPAKYLPGVTRRDDGLMLVYDVRAFLSADEALRLHDAVTMAESRRA